MIFLFQDDKPESIQKVANKIAHVAHELSFDPEYMSPFAFNAAANGFENVTGEILLLFGKWSAVVQYDRI